MVKSIFSTRCAVVGLWSRVIFIVRRMVEKAVDMRFYKTQKLWESNLQRRSRFEEKILLDQYAMVIKLQEALSNLAADINRHHKGRPVPGLIVNAEVEPLTAIYIDLQSKQFLLKKNLFDILMAEANTLLILANAESAADIEAAGQNFLELTQQLHRAMNHVFGIEAINWQGVTLPESEH